MTLTAIAAKVYYALLSIVFKLKSRNFFEKTERFSEKSIHNLTNSDYCRIIKGVRTKNHEQMLLFVDFSKTFDSIQREKME